VIAALDLDFGKAAAHLADFTDLPGRGAQHRGRFNGKAISLIDDSYNAGPASMNAALGGFGDSPPSIMVLSDMLELGTGTEAAHAALVPIIAKLEPRMVIAIGPAMARMAATLRAAKPSIKVIDAKDSSAAFVVLRDAIMPGDRIFIKGSNGSGARLVANALLAALRPEPAKGRAIPPEGESHAA